MSITSTVLTLRRRLLKLTETLSGLAPLLIRITVAVVFVRTGWAKLSDLPRFTEYFASLGIPMPGINAAVAASVEFFGGILILVGLGARLVALPMAFTMVVAIITAKREEIQGVLSIIGFEEFSYLVMFVTIVLIGAGPFSLDALIARRLRARAESAPPRPVLHPETSTAPQS
jgi:putative oxidoreductase